MKKGTVFVLAALVIIAAVLFFTQSWIIPSADPYFDGYIFLVASSDGYNLGYKLFTNKKFETVSVKNFDDLHKKLEKYVSEMDELEMLEVPDYLFMDKDDKIIYPVVRATHNSKLHIRHEHHYEILKIIKDFEAQVFLKTADGEKYQSFTVLDFVEIDPDLIPPEIDDGEFADKATDEVLIAALEYAFIGNIFCYSYSDPTAAVECVAERCLMDSDENEIGCEPYLLINATDIAFEALWGLVREYGGVMFPAHIDKESNSVLSNLGFFPPDPPFRTLEIKDLKKLHSLKTAHPFINDCLILSNSDAHYLEAINQASLSLLCEERSADAVIDAILRGPVKL